MPGTGEAQLRVEAWLGAGEGHEGAGSLLGDSTVLVHVGATFSSKELSLLILILGVLLTP